MMRVIKSTNEIDYDKLDTIKELYHSCDSKEEYLDVLENGIEPDDMGYIYLSEKPFRNSKYTLIIRIPNNSKLHDWREFWCDEDGNEIDFNHEYDPSNPYYIYTSFIDPVYIREM